MPWYSAGTVTVTNGSPTVTGSGTQFSANVRVGDAFRGPDGGWYEVTNIASATVLSINPPYEGANAAGAPYRIAPIQGYVKESADRLRMIVEQWGQELGELGEMSAVGQAIIQAVDAAAQRAVLQLGTAAVRNVVGNPTDTSPGRVMVTGSAGWNGLNSTNISDANQLTVSGSYQLPTGAPATFSNFPEGADPTRSTVLVMGNFAPYGVQVYFERVSGGVHIRHHSGGFGTWGEMWTDATTTAAGRALASAANAAAQRGILELGTAAVRDVVSSSTEYDENKVINPGYAGLGAPSGVNRSNQSDFDLCGFGRASSGGFGSYPSFIQTGDSLTHQTQIGGRTLDADNFQFIKKVGGVWGTARTVRHSGNTTVDGNGFLKNASPITQLYADRVENNDQAEDVTLQKQSTGVYQLLTERRFAEEGWYIETPKDANGNIKVFVTYEENDQGILIQTFEPDYSTGRVVAGAPVDIPDGRWIDVRLTYTQAEIDQKAADVADYEAQLAAQNVIESTENNPQEAEPDE